MKHPPHLPTGPHCLVSPLTLVPGGGGQALRVNVTFRGYDRCPGNEKNRDWLWAELGEEEEKAELRKDKQSSVETRSGFCKE